MAEIFDIPLRGWQECLGWLDQATARAGRNARVDQADVGATLHGGDGLAYEHPWWTTGRWDPALGKWVVAVKPGFVNGIDPIFQGQLGDIPLLDAPAQPVLGWRVVGGELGVDNERVPPFFLALGVAERKTSLAVTSAGGLIDRTDELPPSGVRQLRAVDVVVSVARPALTGSVQIVDPTATSGQEVVYSVGLDAARLEAEGARARLRLESKYEQPAAPSLAERLLGLYSDPTEDTRLISTLWVLSPPNAGDGASPDATWRSYRQHNTFWNLGHASRNVAPKQPPAPIRLFTGLLGGIGDAIGNQILAQINEFSDRVNNAVNNVSMEGRFYR